MVRPVLLLGFALGLLGCGELKPLANTPAPNTSPSVLPEPVQPGELLAGVAKVEITNKTILPLNDPLFVKALVLKNGATIAVLITVDAVAIGEIGHIGNDYLDKVRGRVQKELKIAPENVTINASHCHGIVCTDVAEKTFEAVKAAAENMVPVNAGVGVGHESRVSENRRLKLKSGREADVRHAYALPPDEEVAGVGPIDPQIGVLRLDKKDGQTLAVVYTFACHPIMGVLGDGNTADIAGFASKVIEDNLSAGTVALFVQGCGGDINPVRYKDVHHPRHAEPLGNMLGLNTLQAVRKIRCSADAVVKVHNETIQLPRADHSERIEALIAEQSRLVKLLQGTSLNFKTFLELAGKYNLSKEFPSYSSHLYLTEQAQGRSDLLKLDDANRKNLRAYLSNIETMEQITRVQANLALLQKHQAANLAAGRKPLEAELTGLRVGDFVLVTFPGELTVEIGLNVKKTSPHKSTFVAGYTNGYIYYTPTAQQLRNRGGAQEDSDCRLAPEWEQIFYEKVAVLLKKL
ncbi:Uncharacterized protein OS=Singulisphaera acidiphila (strain ATCC BAA-1392 / DSM 18658 / VKM B-2454 / MOB10) GN=Sinac_3781 PE=4 SV=1 [Gemmata massiliana]|uniref:Neutral/alkaline non-lysosomal ceramidase N-terminal domain-containing protein n=1 Tax=Gemmata massiliana TaxID=1210884 RepID=A0A6P2CY27_9BACT|nr:hypothetical protein [Gemmata massiliana]VTR92100.1 Uncharacterized protein OS=Singulisphaera acidiphila (strain ATCC BAA-1392 / DSM 18658 / VKM B-2454 / MOB10) GN=Sinac_3781 PE=4 SV=1 [Gemmata massiliana]